MAEQKKVIVINEPEELEDREFEEGSLLYIIGYLSKKASTKNINLLIWAAKKKRADIVHPQMELFK